MAEDRAQPGDLSGRSLLVAVCGGIAAYKTCTVVSRLAQAGAEVSVLMTEAATKLVGPATFQSLSGRPVVTSIWEPIDAWDAQHIALARRAQLLLIAPATANTIAKLAHGICDNAVTTIACALPQATPVLLAPAMNAEMWNSPITQANVRTLSETLGWQLVGPESGWQACRTSGIGRMSEAEAIVRRVREILAISD
jgi:phosphopantothenoylcysteine decarboxylase/phosphopantothenate--cysteine ligase